MKIVMMKVADIETAAYNPRVPLEPGMPEFEKLRASMKKFGVVEPLVWNERTGRLVGGHQRLTILQHEGIEEVGVSVVDLDEPHEKALNLALNNPNLQGEWDTTRLIQMAEELPDDLLALAGWDDTEEVHDLVRRSTLAESSDFLTDLIEEAEPGAPLPQAMAEEEHDARPKEVELKEEHQHRTGEQTFDVTVVLTAEQRAIYYQAIDRAKRANNTSNSFEALTYIMDDFNKRWDREHMEAGAGETLETAADLTADLT